MEKEIEWFWRVRSSSCGGVSQTVASLTTPLYRTLPFGAGRCAALSAVCLARVAILCAKIAPLPRDVDDPRHCAKPGNNHVNGCWTPQPSDNADGVGRSAATQASLLPNRTRNSDLSADPDPGVAADSALAVETLTWHTA
jgi:hypothetical protein